MNILVTGSGGYLGNVLCPMLENNGHSLIKLDLGIFGVGDYTKFDLSSDSLLKFSDHKIDAIIHLAGISNDPASELHPGLTNKMNVQASQTLVRFAVSNKISKFIFASSASVYGVSNKPSTEKHIPNPLSTYAESKVIIENLILSKQWTDTKFIILRFGTLFGTSPKNRFDLAINLMAKDSAVDNVIKVFGDGNQYRPFLCVQDAARAIIHALNYDKPILTNIVTDNIKIVDLASMLSDIFNSKIEYIGSNNDNRNYKLDNTVMSNVFGFTPLISIEDGAKDIYNWSVKYSHLVNNDIYYTIKMWKKFYREYTSG